MRLFGSLDFSNLWTFFLFSGGTLCSGFKYIVSILFFLVKPGDLERIFNIAEKESRVFLNCSKLRKRDNLANGKDLKKGF